MDKSDHYRHPSIRKKAPQDFEPFTTNGAITSSTSQQVHCTQHIGTQDCSRSNVPSSGPGPAQNHSSTNASRCGTGGRGIARAPPSGHKIIEERRGENDNPRYGQPREKRSQVHNPFRLAFISPGPRQTCPPHSDLGSPPIASSVEPGR